MSVLVTSLRRPPMVGWPAAASGAGAGLALLGLYLGVIAIAQGPSHALEQLAVDARYVAAVTIGFAVQVALFVELRQTAARQRRSAAITAASTGTSTAAMLACCAHHVADVLPLVGLSAAAVFLDAYKMPLLVVGLTMNAIGVTLLWRELTRLRRAEFRPARDLAADRVAQG